MTHAPNSLAARDIAYTVHPFTNLRAHEEQGPLVITKGEGVWVEDDEGTRYIEGLAGLWCAGLGFSEHRLVEAAAEQMRKMPYSQIFSHRSHQPVIELAEKLIGMAPGNIAKVFFVNSGSEAIDSALKLIWYYQNARGKTDKKIILHRHRAYHGIALAGGHMTGLPYARNGFDLPMADRFHALTCPSYYRDGRDGESESQFTDRLIAELESVIEEKGADRIAAFVAEPVMGAGGVIVPPRDYLARVAEVCRANDILFVADEVINGFGRTGNMWGAETFGIEPDLVTCAKQLSSAYLPIAALMMTDEVYQVIADQSKELGVLGTGYTYSGHPVPAAVALRTLQIYEEDDILGHVQAVAPRFQKRLKALEAHPLVGETRGVGLIGGLEIVADKNSRAQFPPADKAAARIVAHIQKAGLILRALPGDSIGICPPLIITEQEIDQLFDRLARGLDDALGELRAAA